MGIPVPVSLTLTAVYRPGGSSGRVGRDLVDVDVGGLDDQLPASRHRVAGVDGEVDQYLLDLATVGEHRPQIAARSVTSSTCSPRVRAQQLLHLPTTSLRLSTRGWMTSWRAKASS